MSKAQELAYWLERDGANCQRHVDCAQELRRLEAALKRANSNHEEFERRYYLEQQAKEELLCANKELLEALKEAQPFTLHVGARIIEESLKKHGGGAT